MIITSLLLQLLLLWILIIILSSAIVVAEEVPPHEDDDERRHDGASVSVRPSCWSDDHEDGRRHLRQQQQQDQEEDEEEEWNPEYYDVLRQEADETQVYYENGSSVYEVVPPTASSPPRLSSPPPPLQPIDINDDNNSNSIPATLIDDEEKEGDGTTTPTYFLADIKAFLHFTYDGMSIFPETQNDAFAVLLAAYHFNNVYSSPILSPANVSQCPGLKLTVELLDSEASPIETTRTCTAMLQRRYSLHQPPPAAVVGAFSSSVTLPLGILSGVNNIPQVSQGATSIEFDDKDQYPLFGRTVCSSTGEAQVAVEFFKSIESTHVAILFVTGAYGSALQKSFQDAANKAQIITESVALPFYVDVDAIKGAITQLQKLQYQHVYAIFPEKALEPIMTLALQENVAGSGYLWVFPGLVIDRFKEYNFTSAEAKALNGMGLIQMQGGVISDGFVAGNYRAPPLQPDSHSGYQRFRESWSSALKNETFIKYVQKRLPSTLDGVPGFDRSASFDTDPGVFRPFLYDVVTSLGLSMCRASAAASTDDDESPFFTGKQVYSQFRELNFQGASGNVTTNNRTGTRDYNTIAFTLWNIRSTEKATTGGKPIVEFVPSKHFASNQWFDIPDNAFVYSTGFMEAPLSLPNEFYNFNYIGEAGRIIGYVLIAITCLSSLLSVIWLYWYRNEKILVSAQPRLLLMVSFGVVVMVFTIIPLGLEETVVQSEEGLDKACMASPWLYFLGVTIALSSLLAKIYGVHRAYMNPELDFIHVSVCDVLLFFMIYLILNFIVLMTWTEVDPLRWQRNYTKTSDMFNKHFESVGYCEGDHGLSYIFAIVMVVINFAVLILGNWWAYTSRNIETECNENTFVGLSMAAVLQAWAMGIPITIVVWGSPPAKYYVQICIVFITSLAVLSLVYIPKVIALHKAHLEAKKVPDPKKAEYANFLQKYGQKQPPATTPSKAARTASSAEKHSTGGQNPQEPLDEPEAEQAHEQLTTNSITASNASPETGQEQHSGLFRSSIQQEEGGDPGSQELSAGKLPPNPAFPGVEDPSGECEELAGRPGLGGLGRRAVSLGSKRLRASFARMSLPQRRSLFVGALNSKDVPEDMAGIRVLHNPRSPQNLELAGGVEVPRTQLKFILPTVEGEEEKPADQSSNNAAVLENVMECEESSLEDNSEGHHSKEEKGDPTAVEGKDGGHE